VVVLVAVVVVVELVVYECPTVSLSYVEVSLACSFGTEVPWVQSVQ